MVKHEEASSGLEVDKLIEEVHLLDARLQLALKKIEVLQSLCVRAGDLMFQAQQDYYDTQWVRDCNDWANDLENANVP